MLQVFRCQTLADALLRVLEIEAVFSTTKACYKVSVAEPDTEENKKVEKLLEKLQKTNRWPFCSRCGRQGHLERDYHARSPVPRRSTQQRRYRYLKAASTHHRYWRWSINCMQRTRGSWRCRTYTWNDPKENCNCSRCRSWAKHLPKSVLVSWEEDIGLSWLTWKMTVNTATRLSSPKHGFTAWRKRHGRWWMDYSSV